ncbi:MAG: phosphoribosylglycinamide synthetase C domain-containing protein, partial [Rhodanobacteraceae bacterium]
GTKLDAQGRVVTAGGRVLTACALGDDLSQARDHAYAAVDRIRFDGAFCRRDIGHRALKRH